MRTIFLVTLTVLVLSACATIDSKKKSSTFETAMFRYEKAMRWSEFGLADSMRRLPEGQLPAQPVELLEHIRITAYETLGTNSNSDGSEIRVAVRIRYYHDDGLKVGTLIDNQVWKYDEEQKTWYITTPLPTFR
jgi:hypothetical protein